MSTPDLTIENGARASLPSLMAALFDGGLTESETVSLRAMIADDERALDRYVDIASTHALLAWEHSGADRVELTPQAPATDEPSDARGTSYPIGAIGGAIVGIAAALMIAVLYSQYAFIGDPAPVDPARGADAPIATLIGVSDGSTVFIDNEIAEPGGELPLGTYTIESGAAELLLDGGAGVELRGRSALAIHGPLAATLRHGAATFTCPPTAHGFTVTLADGRQVVDLGTRFSVEITGEGDAVVTVHEGRVELRPPAAATSSDEPAMPITALEVNEQAHWTPRGVNVTPVQTIAPAPADGDALAIVNPSFESAPDAKAIDGWSIAADTFFAVAKLGGTDPETAHAGQTFLTANRDAGALAQNPKRSEATQTIDLADYAERIDSGSLTVRLAFAYSAKDGQDSAVVRMNFRGPDGKAIGAPLQTRSLTNAPPVDTAWAQGELTGTIPTGARSVELTLRADRTAGTRTNVSFDNVRGWLIDAPANAGVSDDGGVR